jgi:hypothetical protein
MAKYFSHTPGQSPPVVRNSQIISTIPAVASMTRIPRSRDSSRLSRRRFLVAIAAMTVVTTCSCSSNAEPTAHAVCGYRVGQGAVLAGGPDFVDLAGKNPPTSEKAYAVGVKGNGTVVRVSSNCSVGATVIVDPSTAAQVVTVVTAKNGKPEAVRVALEPTSPTTTLVVTQSDGTRRRLKLLNPTTSNSSG